MILIRAVLLLLFLINERKLKSSKPSSSRDCFFIIQSLKSNMLKMLMFSINAKNA